jgi:hypothetical protein
LIVAFLFQDLFQANESSSQGIAWDELGADAAVMLAFITVAFFLRGRQQKHRPDCRPPGVAGRTRGFGGLFR